ncbi:KAP family P-loop NTPase fold protein [Microbacterium hydrocarbonoxydans]|uniref:KAP family P-loop NTPase fold protein n=1 Tax=Microbacterium hydrocarbonoxydans TaxID=273678 RepID=UPI0020416811|nr:P-loop NTPase fold protein [Microbacterium hydrocarbonoxydans]MCM3780658.1 KAP family NTPase [Microbacterium hydrocarbonoxydans]
MSTPASENWYADDPISSMDDDNLDRSKFIAGLESILFRVHGSEQSSVLALIGAWGSGKSSVLAQLTSKLEMPPHTTDGDPGRSWVAIAFNPWYFQDLASLQSGFFAELLDALPLRASWDRARDSIAGLGRAIAPFGAIFGLVGLDATGPLNGLATAIGTDQGVATKRRMAEDALRKAESPVLVIIDDVDRLDPPELLLLFKLIRLVGRLPNVHYLLAYDENTLLDALSRTGLVGSQDPRRAIDYLEKIVQIRLDMPPVRDEQLSSWVNSALERLASTHGLSLDDEVSRRFSSAYFGHLRQRLATPRGVKRYFAQVDVFLAGLLQEVDLVDFLLISWIRSAEPLLYRAIIDNRGRLLGDFSTISSEWGTGKRDTAAEHAFWEGILADARVAPEHRAGVAQLVGQLFPRFEHQWSQRNYSYSGDKPASTRIAHPHYFDRYFAFAVPAEDLSDLIVAAAFDQIRSQTRGSELDQVEASFDTGTELVLGKLESLSVPGSASSVEVLKWLVRHYHRVPEHTDIADAHQRTRWFGGRLYVRMDESQRLEVLEEAKLTPSGLFFFSYLSHAARSRPREGESNEPTSAMPDLVDQAFAIAISNTLWAHIKTPPIDLDRTLWGLVWDWARIDIDAARQWVCSGLEDHGWDALDFAARFVTVTISLGVKDPTGRTGDFDADFLGQLVDWDGFEHKLQLDTGDSSIVLEHELPATVENRRLVARKRLAQFFAEREQQRG